MKTSGLIDGLVLVNSETYINLVRVTNSIGYQYILRSSGVTIQGTPLLPGKVYDGSIAGFDLNILPSPKTVSANWNGFGLSPDAIVQIDANNGKVKNIHCGLYKYIVIEYMYHSNKDYIIKIFHNE